MCYTAKGILKELFNISYDCCGSCHEDSQLGFDDCMEKYTKFKDIYFRGCCGFPKLTDEQWKAFEVKLENA